MIELIVVVIILAMLAAILLPALARANTGCGRASCQNNLKQMGLVYKMYANDTIGEFFPPITSQRSLYTVGMATIYPEYLTDVHVLRCPNSELDIDDHVRKLNEGQASAAEGYTLAIGYLTFPHYSNVGFALQSDADASAFVGADSDALRAAWADERFGEHVRLAEGIDARPKLGRRALGHDGHGLVRAALGNREAVAAHDLDAERVEILRRHELKRRSRSTALDLRERRESAKHPRPRSGH